MKTLLLISFLLVPAFSSVRADDPPQPKKYTVYGEVITVYNDRSPHGALIECEERGRIGTSEAKGIVFLIGHPKQSDLVDGVKVDCVATQNGHYDYTSAMGAKKTVMAVQFVSGH